MGQSVWVIFWGEKRFEQKIVVMELQILFFGILVGGTLIIEH